MAMQDDRHGHHPAIDRTGYLPGAPIDVDPASRIGTTPAHPLDIGPLLGPARR